ncbi:MAG: adenylosuccinate lyase [Phycisphaerales bacterium]
MSAERYRSPLETRYASDRMQSIWSDRHRIGLWRRLWLALAESQHELGLPVTAEQVAELREHLDDIDFERAREFEAELRHDVMAHVHTLREVAPTAGPIVHLGATSQFVNCNAELLMLHESLGVIAAKLAATIGALSEFARTWRALPTLAFTHYQPAQPTTVGRRAAGWAYDLSLCLEDIEARRDGLRLRGVKGTTGTQASFMALMDNDADRVDELDRLVCERMGWDADRRLLLTGQTYPRLIDAQVLGSLATVAAVLHKITTDIRLLANRKELEEPFESKQIGSSAMAYKRNPMRCERIGGMARFVMGLAQNPLQTAAVQWLERTLDDSSNRRLVLPEAFLALDGCLDVMRNVASGMVVYEHTVVANLAAELPFMATENLLMAAVRGGADRQDAHEVIRTHSQAAAQAVKQEGKPNDLLARIAGEPMFDGIDLDDVLDPAAYVGRAPEQVDRFLAEVAGPIAGRYADSDPAETELRV